VNVLVTSVSRKVTLVQAFKRAIQAVGGGKVLAGDISLDSAALYMADDGIIMPRSDEPDFIDWVSDLCARESISLIVPTRDEELPVFAEHSAGLLSRGVRVAVSPAQTVEICQDKSAFLEFCVREGFSVPRVLEPHSVGAEDYPVFVKPRRGKGGIGATRVEDSASLDSILAQTPDVIIQEYCDLPEYTLDVFADFKGRVLSVVPRQRVVVIAGESYVSRTTRAEPLIDRGGALVERLNLHGHGTVQCFFDGSNLLFIEVNPRYGGGASLGWAAGHPTPEYLVRLVLGEEIEPRIGEFEDGMTMLRYTQDIFLDPRQRGNLGS